MGKVKRVWKVEPSLDQDYDYCILAAEDNEDHRTALRYAQEVLEQQWDDMYDDPSSKSTVSMELIDTNGGITEAYNDVL